MAKFLANMDKTILTPLDEDRFDIVVSLASIGKQYQLFDDPQDRLKNMLFWRFGKSYGHIFWAVRDVTFQLRRGEMLAIIGKNGSGKSTVLQMIAGTLSPTEGTISCSGRVGALLELGSGFNPDYTGRENIELNASILGISSNELKGKIDSIIEFADIGDYIDQPVKFYSSGMFVRLAFAVTTGLDADILLIDEALAVGDIFFRQKCYQRLAELRTHGVSIILVTHSMGDVEQFCERAILLDHGKELFQGPASEAVKRYYLLEQHESPAHPGPTFSQDQPTLAPQPIGATAADPLRPVSEAFFDISHVAQISNGWARCMGVALCDESGRSNRVFEQGQIAHFFYEFEMLEDIEVPHGGVELQNDKGIIVHGKSTLENNAELPFYVRKGSLVCFQQTIALELQPGEYTFNMGFSTLKLSDYQRRSTLGYMDVHARLIRICLLPKVGMFTIIPKKPFSQILHHGIANLPGNSTVSVINSIGMQRK